MPVVAQVLLIAVVIGAAAVWMYRAGRRADDVRRSRFEGREDLSVREFKDRFFASEPVEESQISALLDEVALAFDLPRGKLRPSDRFAVEFAPVKGWETDDGIGVLAKLLAKRADSSGEGAAVNRVETLGDYLRVFIAQSR